ncbi:Cupin domain-containing protein [Rhodovastum atsumiense]|uniref:Cupin domain-containing protein n=1 Tax=Rhodovastum atsumiense TaxID=504468 RepID=A0A5M6IVE3_9PROT|nr:cupin domain-containing protein [Rhodovastum atsumiense]KAA5612276.1 cupin domain-containing protein [Rhodovastum atsumiense]CAH2601602.1 Cupin domain-containing protein [Rhodovastum atsumiense]
MVRLFNETLVPSLRGAPVGFTGTVWRDEIARGGAPHDLRVYRVSFEPGSRTAWHTHPSWQVLHVLSGIGRLQSRGGELITLRPGDSAWIDPEEEHWHGAAPDHHFVHIAIHMATPDDREVTWLEQVADAEYR